MLTPTGVTASAYWEAIKNGNPTHARMVFDQNVVVDDQDIDITTGLVVTDVLNGDTDLTFGRAVCKQVCTNILLTNRTELIPWSKEFRLDMGVEISGTTNWVTIGYFAGERPNNVTTVKSVEFMAYDRMTMFEQLADVFWSGLDFTTPLKLSDIYHALCTYVGIQYVSGDELSASFNRTYSAAPMDLTGYTCRDVLAWIAEAVGCYAKITADGKCKLVWFTDATSYEITQDEEFNVEHADMYSGMTWDEFDTYKWDEAEVFTWDEVEGYYSSIYGIRGMKVKQTNLGIDVDYPSTQPWNIYTIMDNPFLQIEDLVNDPVTYIKPIYDRLIALGGQLPMTAECIGNWCVEAGDIISIHIADEIIHAPLFMKTLRWVGSAKDEYEVTGQKFRKIINDFQKQRVINNRNIKLFVEGKYYNVVNGIEIDENGVDITGDRYIKIQVNNTNAWEYNIYGMTLQEPDEWYVMKFWLGKDPMTGVYRSKTAMSIRERTETVSSVPYTINGIALTCSREWMDNGTKAHLFGQAIFEPLLNSTGTSLTVSFYPMNSQTYDLGGGNNLWRRVYSPYIIGSHTTSEDRVQIVPSEVDMQTRLKIYTDSSNLIVEKAGTSAKTLIFIGTVQAPSSKDVKKDIAKLESKGNVIDNLSPVSFKYKNDVAEKTHYGLIYEDAVKLIPDLCSEMKSDENEGQSNKSINYVELVPVLIKEIQELRKRVALLESRKWN